MEAREQLLEKMVTSVMEGFDFEKVLTVMRRLGWKWSTTDSEMAVPSMYRLMKKAEELLKEAVSHYGEKEFFATGFGGLTASLDGSVLVLQFVLEEYTSHAGDYITDETDPQEQQPPMPAPVKVTLNGEMVKAKMTFLCNGTQFNKDDFYPIVSLDTYYDEDDLLKKDSGSSPKPLYKVMLAKNGCLFMFYEKVRKDSSFGLRFDECFYVDDTLKYELDKLKI